MRRKHLSFTIIELLMVMVIIGILASIAAARFINVNREARISKARHAVSLVLQAEKQIQTETGNYVTITLPGDTVDGRVGRTASGIDLRSIDADNNWDYSVALGAANVITATEQGGACVINLDMDTEVWTLGAGCS